MIPLSIGAAIYSSMSLFAFSSCPRWLKIFGTIFLLACSLKFFWYKLAGTGWISPQLPWLLSVILESAFNFIAVLFFVLLCRDIIFIIAGFSDLVFKTGWASGIRACKVNIALVSISFCLGIWGYYSAVKVPETVSISLSLPNFPPMKAAHLSDLHIEQNLDPEWLKSVVDKTNGENPDIVFITGDFADGYPDDLSDRAALLSGLKAPVFGVTGNHERYWGGDAWREKLERFGIVFPEGKPAKIKIRGQDVTINGIPDKWIGKDGEWFKKMPESSFLLVHNPKRNAEFAGKADLILSGHTHGGQVLPFQWLAAKINNGFASGLYGNSLVSNGTGLWRGMPIRLGVSAQILIININ